MAHATTFLLTSSTPWWRTALDILAVFGTVGAAVAAVWAARGAQAIAKADRKAAIAREQDERRYDRERAELQGRLDLALAALRAAETWFAIPDHNTAERGQARGELLGALAAIDEPLPVCHQIFLLGAGLTAELRDAAERDYGLAPDQQSQPALTRAELRAVIKRLQRQLYPD